ncbi:hypothetical protein LINPERHAP1_LOCUS33073, partial [Linum perenne]
YYNFRLQYRRVEGKTLIRSGKALQHFCIDAFTTIEQNRLIYLRLNQKNYVQTYIMDCKMLSIEEI